MSVLGNALASLIGALCGALVLFVSVSVATVLIWQQYAATQTALVRAETNQKHAQDNFEKALAAVDQMLIRVGDETLRDIPHMEAVRR